MAITSTDPATGEQLREFAPLTPSAIEDKLSCADRAARSWRIDAARRPHARASPRRRPARRAQRRVRPLMTLEMGKTIAAAKDEAAKCATSLSLLRRSRGRISRRRTGRRSTANASYVAFEPLGVVLAVMPWNFPFWQVIRFAAPALAAGNVGLLKHASNVPQCALALEQLFADAGAPAGVFQTLLIEAGQVESLIADERIAAVDAHRERSRGQQRRRRSRRTARQEDGARAGRQRSVHRHGERGPRRGRADRRDGAHDQQRPVVHRREALHRRAARSSRTSRTRFVERMRSARRRRPDGRANQRRTAGDGARSATTCTHR